MLGADIIAAIAGINLERDYPLATGVCFNSARVRQGEVFFALQGEKQHGVSYAADALARGAAYVVSDQPFPGSLQVGNAKQVLLDLGSFARAQLQGPVIGITGSAGKTSTKTMVATALAAQSSPGNFNTPLALAEVLVGHWQSAYKNEALVLELGIDHPGEMDQLIALVRPTHGMLTLIAEAHLEQLGSLEGVAEEKSKLLQAAKYAYVSKSASHFLTKTFQHPALLCYGLQDEKAFETRHCQATLEGRIVASSPNDQHVRVEGQSFCLPVPGEAMATNAVGALALALSLGIGLEKAANRLQHLVLEPGRLAVDRLGPLTLIDDSYNSNPASLREALSLLKRYPRPHTAILGDILELGASSRAIHQQLARDVAFVDRLITIGPMAAEFASAHASAKSFSSTSEAQAYLQTLSLEGSVLLKASRGMHFERLCEVLKVQVLS